jgi:hypothetical protein
MILRLTWHCDGPDAGYKARDRETNMGCQVNHLWDNDRKFFHGYDALVGRTGSWSGFKRLGTYANPETRTTLQISAHQSTYFTWHGLLMSRRCGHCANS